MPRVLVVEDVLLVAMDIELMLRGAGYEVVGPVGRLRPAVELASAAAIDCALLDLDLRGALSTPVAYALRRRGIPFAFVTGDAHSGMLPADLLDRPVLEKPLSEQRCLATVTQLLAEQHDQPAGNSGAAARR
ncbi:MAG: response regulator [Dongiaceae bacterium]